MYTFLPTPPPPNGLTITRSLFGRPVTTVRILNNLSGTQSDSLIFSLPFPKMKHSQDFAIDSRLLVRQLTPVPPPPSAIHFEPHSGGSHQSPNGFIVSPNNGEIISLYPITGLEAFIYTGMTSENLNPPFHHKICYRTPKK